MVTTIDTDIQQYSPLNYIILILLVILVIIIYLSFYYSSSLAERFNKFRQSLADWFFNLYISADRKTLITKTTAI
jgi:hypothetical protein